MALKDFFASVGDKLEETFNTKAYDPSKARKALVRSIEAARDQYANGRTKVPNRWWTTSNDVVSFSPKLGSTPLVINGKTTNFIPANRFDEFLDEFKAEVEGGSFDKEIEAIEAGTGNAGSSVAMNTAPRARKPMSDEAKEKIRQGALRRHEAARAAKGG